MFHLAFKTLLSFYSLGRAELEPLKWILSSLLWALGQGFSEAPKTLGEVP